MRWVRSFLSFGNSGGLEDSGNCYVLSAAIVTVSMVVVLEVKLIRQLSLLCGMSPVMTVELGQRCQGFQGFERDNLGHMDSFLCLHVHFAPLSAASDQRNQFCHESRDIMIPP